jgi:hypothetical protein
MEMVFRSCVEDAKARGQTVFLSSHILSEVEALCDRVGILRDGRLVDEGALAELRHLSPLLALWAIWVGIGISSRSSDVRVAQQLATLAGLPLLGFTSLISFQILTPSVPLAIGLALALLAADVVAWQVVSRLFDRERLVTGPGRDGRGHAPGEPQLVGERRNP